MTTTAPTDEKSFTIAEVVDIKPEDIAQSLQRLLVIGSKKGIISITDLKLEKNNGSEIEKFSSIEEGLDEGNKLFDVILYFQIPDSERPEITERGIESGVEIMDRMLMARYVFYLAFMLLTRAGISDSTETTVGSVVPKFLSSVLGYNYSPKTVKDGLASFDLNLMEHTWIKELDWSALSMISKNRFALGVAGYRMLSPFKYLEPKAEADDNVRNACRVARKLATDPADWDVHPITRSTDFLTFYGPLNANLGNLMLKAFTTEELAALVTRKAIYAQPTVDPTANDWIGWNIENMRPLVNPIFGSTDVVEGATSSSK